MPKYKFTAKPLSVDRVRNRLKAFQKRSKTKTLSDLHNELLDDLRKLENQLSRLADSIDDHEKEQALHDQMHERVRAHRVKEFGEDSFSVSAMDYNRRAYLERRLIARDVAGAIEKYMEDALKAFLDPRKSMAALKGAAELGFGVAPGVEPMSFLVQIARSLDEMVDRLETQREEAEIYVASVEAFRLVVRGFTGIFRTLLQRVEYELDTIAF